MDSSGKTVMDNTNENKQKLIEELQSKVAYLDNVVENCKMKLESYLEQAKNYDINYVPDLEAIKNLLDLKDKLANVTQTIIGINLTEDNIIQEGTYIEAAQKLLELIDEKIKELENNFKTSNAKRFKESNEQKIELEIKLSNLEIELESLMGEKKELENNLSKRFLGRKKRKLYTSLLQENSEKIRDTNSEIAKLKIKLEANTFNVNPNGSDKTETGETNSKDGMEPAE